LQVQQNISVPNQPSMTKNISDLTEKTMPQQQIENQNFFKNAALNKFRSQNSSIIEKSEQGSIV
jgi:hypothetical protein